MMQPGNLLKIETLEDGWYDKDHVLLHACFQLLSDFVENEMAVNNCPDWNATDESKKAKMEIENLYAWWQTRKDDSVMDNCSSSAEEEVLYNNDNKMLKRLIDVREFLWT